MIGKIITAVAMLALVSLGAVSVQAYAQRNDTEMNNTNITIAGLAQNVSLAPVGNVTIANLSSTNQGQAKQNQTESFEAVENSTAILNAEIDRAKASENQTDRAEIKTAISDALKALRDVANKVDTATSEQMRTLQGASEAITDGIQESFND